MYDQNIRLEKRIRIFKNSGFRSNKEFSFNNSQRHGVCKLGIPQNHMYRYRTRIGFNADPDPAFFPFGFWWPEIVNIFRWNFYFYFFDQKLLCTVLYLSVGPHKGHPNYRRSLHPSKENIQHFKPCNFFTLLVIFALLDTDPDPDEQNTVNADPCWSGFTTLLYTVYHCQTDYYFVRYLYNKKTSLCTAWYEGKLA